MVEWKDPPKAKVYEAMTAVGDQRITLDEDHRCAEVVSSSGKKKYVVEWSVDGRSVTSNDNASYWQGYMGYPIVALVLIRGLVQYSPEVAVLLKGIPWKELNAQYRNDYDRAVEAALKAAQAKGGDRKMIMDEIDNILRQVHELHLEKLPKRRLPPK